jgi:outer membrane protein assembly factor BamB
LSPNRRLTARAILLSLALPLALPGCSSLPWLGEKEPPPLPGTRRSVLLTGDTPVADVRVAGLPVTVPAAVPLPSWPQQGGNASHSIGNIAGQATLTRVWDADIGSGGSEESPLLSPPVVAEAKVFAVDGDGAVTALAAGDGSRLWRRSYYKRTPDRLAGGGIAYDTGRLFIALAPGEVIAASASNGEEIWRVDLRTPLRASPTIAGGRVLVRTADNQLIALDAASGDIAWRHTGLFEPAGILGGAPPASAGQAVVVAYSSGEVFWLLLDSGRPLWSDSVLRPRRALAVNTISDITGAPVIDGGQVYVAGASGEMAAIDLGRGTRQWELALTSYDTPWIAGDFVFTIAQPGELVAVVRDRGQIRWVTRIADTLGADEVRPGTLWSGPVMVGGRLIVVGTSGDILAFSASDGSLLARSSIGDGTRLQPVVADGTIYVLDDSGDVVAFR